MADTDTIELTVEAAGPCRKRVKVTIPPARVSEEFDKSLRQWTRSVPIPGFRQGKAPQSLIEKRYGNQVAVEVKQALLDAALTKAFKDTELAPISDPELDADSLEVARDTALDFDFTVFVKPEFELPALDGITVEAPPAEPTREQVDGAIERFRRRRATLRPSDGPVESGDVVTLSLAGTADGEEHVNHEEIEYEVGSRFVGDLVTDDLHEALIGKEAGASVTAKGIAAPWQESHPLAGVELVLTAEVLDLKRPDLPELDDAFAKEFDYDTVDDFVEAVRAELRRANESQRDEYIENKALLKLVEQTDLELPEDLIERELDELARRAATDLQMEGKPEEEIAKRVVDVREQRREESIRELKAWFIVDKIVEKERIIVPESEVREAVAQIAQYNQQSPEAMYEALRDAERLSRLRNQLREKKARAKLRKRVQVTDVEAGEPGEAGAGDGEKTAKRKTGEKASGKSPASKKKTSKKEDA